MQTIKTIYTALEAMMKFPWESISLNMDGKYYARKELAKPTKSAMSQFINMEFLMYFVDVKRHCSWSPPKKKDDVKPSKLTKIR